jgi:uncharacterized phiE125 gp8 family phage protein
VNFQISSEPAEEPVTLAEAKLFLRITSNSEDELIKSALVAARRACEKHTRRAFITQTWKMVLDEFPSENCGGGEDWWDGVRETSISSSYRTRRYFDLPMSPLQNVTRLTTYGTDDVGVDFDLTQLVISTKRTPGRIALKTGSVWPIATRGADGIEIVWVAGYGDTAATVPDDLRQAIKLLTSHFYEFRQPVEVAKAGGALEMPWSVDAILNPYVVVKI